MPARTELDRLTAARPAVLHRTEDVVDPAAENHILHQILSSAPHAAELTGARPHGGADLRDGARPDGRDRTGPRRPAWRHPRVGVGLSSAAAVAVATGLAVAALAPGSHAPTQPAGHQPAGHRPSAPAAVHLTSWSVTKLADGSVRVRIIQLRDPAALQAKLRADGVPANVTDTGTPSGACRPYPASTVQLSAVFGGGTGATTDIGTATIIVVINPAALPHDAGIHIGGQFNSAGAGASTSNLVYASAGCTGS